MPVNQFASAREAKEFLVSKIVDEAQRENVPLSDVERKMLYFSEPYWTLPDMFDVSTEFDRDYDETAYEKKIAGIIATAAKRTRKENPGDYAAWWDAIRCLKKEDHYILVMITRAGLRPPGDSLRLSASALGLIVVILAVVFAGSYLADRYNFHPSVNPSNRDFVSFWMWMTAVVVFVAYWLSSLLFGRQRVNEVFDKLIRLVFGRSSRKNRDSE